MSSTRRPVTMTMWIREADTRPLARTERSKDDKRSHSIQTTLTTTTLLRKERDTKTESEQGEKKRSPGRIEKLRRKMKERHGEDYEFLPPPSRQETLDMILAEKEEQQAPSVPRPGSETESETESEPSPSRAVANRQSLYLNAAEASKNDAGEETPKAKSSSPRKRKARDDNDITRARCHVSQRTAKRSSMSSSETEDDATQPLPWSPKQKRSKRSKKKMHHKEKPGDAAILTKSPKTSAITPSKRRSLLEQTAREVAFKQHIARSNTSTKGMRSSASSSSSRSRSASHPSPSPLRSGFSLIELGSQVLGVSEDEEDDGQRLDLDDLQASPLSERSRRQGGMSRIKYALSPGSRRKIFAFETLAADAQVALNESMDLAGTDVLDAVPANAYDHDALQASSSSLSSPPPQPPAEKDDHQQSSSQTEPGGSWFHSETQDYRIIEPQIKKAQIAAETYISDVEVPTDNSDDKTYEESQWVGDTTVKPRRITRALSASTSHEVAKITEPVVQTDEDRRREADASELRTDAAPLPDSDNETQPLPWIESQDAQGNEAKNDSRKSASDPLAVKRSSGLPKDWDFLSQSWPQHVLNDSTNRLPTTKRQSNLSHFGFSCQSQPSQNRTKMTGNRREQSPMSEPEDVHSDDEDGVIDDAVARELPLRSTDASRLALQSDDDSETQSLPWSNKNGPDSPAGEQASSTPSRRSSDALVASSSQMTLEIPSDSGLNSQLRSFLDAL